MVTHTTEGFKAACQLAAHRVAADLVEALPHEVDLEEALPREVNAKACHSKVIGIATDDGLYSALYALDREACKAKGHCVYGHTLTLSRGEPGRWRAFDKEEVICEWTGPWDVRERPWFKARGWCRYEDPVTGDVLDSFVARFDGGVVICGTIVVPKTTWLTLTDPKLASRLLYPNPCVAVTALVDGRRNCMTMSWLTPVDNDGRFVFSMRATRHTAKAVCGDRQPFGLSVLSAGREHRLLAIGGVSGATCDKDVEYYDEDGAFYVQGAVATLAAVVVDVLVEDWGHYVALAKISRARVASDYWVDGKLFAPATPTTPPLLAFLGSKQFAHVTQYS